MAAGAKKGAAGGGKDKAGKARVSGSNAWYVLLLAVIVAVLAFLSGIRYEQFRAARRDAAAPVTTDSRVP